MALQQPHINVTSSVLPAEEGRRMFDRAAWELAQMSGEEFLARWDAGEFADLPDTPETRRILRVAHLIPFGRQESR